MSSLLIQSEWIIILGGCDYLEATPDAGPSTGRLGVSELESEPMPLPERPCTATYGHIDN